MKFRSRLLNLATACAIVLCVAGSALWWRSYRRWDRLVTSWPAEGMGIGSSHGRVAIILRLTNLYGDSLITGLRSTDPWVWGNNVVLHPDPLAINRWNFGGLTNQFEWQTVEGDPPTFVKRIVEGKYDVVLPSVAPSVAGARPVRGDRFLCIAFPHWCLVAALGICWIPRACWLVVQRARRKALARVGRCVQCGYDLRATPDRCPECGMVSTK